MSLRALLSGAVCVVAVGCVPAIDTDERAPTAGDVDSSVERALGRGDTYDARHNERTQAAVTDELVRLDARMTQVETLRAGVDDGHVVPGVDDAIATVAERREHLERRLASLDGRAEASAQAARSEVERDAEQLQRSVDNIEEEIRARLH